MQRRHCHKRVARREHRQAPLGDGRTHRLLRRQSSSLRWRLSHPNGDAHRKALRRPAKHPDAHERARPRKLGERRLRQRRQRLAGLRLSNDLVGDLRYERQQHALLSRRCSAVHDLIILRSTLGRHRAAPRARGNHVHRTLSPRGNASSRGRYGHDHQRKARLVIEGFRGDGVALCNGRQSAAALHRHDAARNRVVGLLVDGVRRGLCRRLSEHDLARPIHARRAIESRAHRRRHHAIHPSRRHRCSAHQSKVDAASRGVHPKRWRRRHRIQAEHEHDLPDVEPSRRRADGRLHQQRREDRHELQRANLRRILLQDQHELRHQLGHGRAGHYAASDTDWTHGHRWNWANHIARLGRQHRAGLRRVRRLA